MYFSIYGWIYETLYSDFFMTSVWASAVLPLVKIKPLNHTLTLGVLLFTHRWGAALIWGGGEGDQLTFCAHYLFSKTKKCVMAAHDSSPTTDRLQWPTWADFSRSRSSRQLRQRLFTPRCDIRTPTVNLPPRTLASFPTHKYAARCFRKYACGPGGKPVPGLCLSLLIVMLRARLRKHMIRFQWEVSAEAQHTWHCLLRFTTNDFDKTEIVTQQPSLFCFFWSWTFSLFCDPDKYRVRLTLWLVVCSKKA